MSSTKLATHKEMRTTLSWMSNRMSFLVLFCIVGTCRSWPDGPGTRSPQTRPEKSVATGHQRTFRQSASHLFIEFGGPPGARASWKVHPGERLSGVKEARGGLVCLPSSAMLYIGKTRFIS